MIQLRVEFFPYRVNGIFGFCELWPNESLYIEDDKKYNEYFNSLGDVLQWVLDGDIEIIAQEDAYTHEGVYKKVRYFLSYKDQCLHDSKLDMLINKLHFEEFEDWLDLPEDFLIYVILTNTIQLGVALEEPHANNQRGVDEQFWMCLQFFVIIYNDGNYKSNDGSGPYEQVLNCVL